MMESIFEFLLGYRPAQWADASFAFGMPVGAAAIAGGLLLVGVVVWLLYKKTTIAVPSRLKVLLIALRSAALMVIGLCLLQPMVTSSKLAPQQGELAVIIDNSSSMTIRDGQDGRSRGEAAAELLFSQSGLLERLQHDFHLRIFPLTAGGRAISSPEDLTFEASRTPLADGLQQVSRILQGLPLAGLILISDGADNGRRDPMDEARIFKTRNIPVFTVGVGRPAVTRDREIIRVTSAKTILEGAIFEVNVTIRSRGYGRQEFEILIEEEGKVVAGRTVKPGPEGAARRYSLELTPDGDGPRVYTVRIPEEPDEIITANNRRTLLLNQADNRADILYIEGHPRNEYKFIRRAVEADKTVRLVSYLKTGPQKFLRQGIESPQELAEGYPRKKEDLYRFAAVIFGDVSRDFFSADQLAMTREFVSERGGGLLMLGGTTALDESYMDTPIADILPVTLLPAGRLPPQLRGDNGRQAAGQKFTLRLTPEGEQAALLRLGIGDEINRQLWEKMPQLEGINVTGSAKPGATVLAEHPVLRSGGKPLPVIAYQRYGRGRSMVITTATTWRWQMLLPHDDLSHERFWRQVLRWLAAAAPSRVELNMDRDVYAAGEQVRARVSVADRTYAPVNDAVVWFKVTGPDGDIRDIPLQWAIEEDGVYSGTFTAGSEGVHQIEAAATLATGEVSQAATGYLVAESNVEYIDAGADVGLLQKIANGSGGKFYPDTEADQLVNDLKRRQKAVTVESQQDIWDIPPVLLTLFALLTVEWWVRRRRGMS
jgi:uncharacterized membrane protein